jgi:lysophospholipase L1-like esterase
MCVYLALGDSISIDDYTGVRGGGAASQLARRLDVDFIDLTRDGNTAYGVLADLALAPAAADVVTLTAGGNDLLGGDRPRAILRRLHQIAGRIQPLGARVVINTVYDPSDGDNDVGRRELGLSRLATIELRRRLNAVNRGIVELARERGFLLADLERLFHGHGIASDEPWFVSVIEPNLAGATAIAEHWYELLVPPCCRGDGVCSDRRAHIPGRCRDGEVRCESGAVPQLRCPASGDKPGRPLCAERTPALGGRAVRAAAAAGPLPPQTRRFS